MMKKIKVKLIGKGTKEEPYAVGLPTWQMVGNCDYTKKECVVTIPEDELLPNGKINQEKIRKKYKKNWGNFKASDVEIFSH